MVIASNSNNMEFRDVQTDAHQWRVILWFVGISTVTNGIHTMQRSNQTIFWSCKTWGHEYDKRIQWTDFINILSFVLRLRCGTIIECLNWIIIEKWVSNMRDCVRMVWFPFVECDGFDLVSIMHRNWNDAGFSRLHNDGEIIGSSGKILKFNRRNWIKWHCITLKGGSIPINSLESWEIIHEKADLFNQMN